mmetsp:Transcript_40351/g.91068  ORF Transcript_40351/g.91068 Transcript_40351/m.91068 type:complete len:273 (-) Transcript_40351:510-1328(-)
MCTPAFASALATLDAGAVRIERWRASAKNGIDLSRGVLLLLGTLEPHHLAEEPAARRGELGRLLHGARPPLAAPRTLHGSGPVVEGRHDLVILAVGVLLATSPSAVRGRSIAHRSLHRWQRRGNVPGRGGGRRRLAARQGEVAHEEAAPQGLEHGPCGAIGPNTWAHDGDAQDGPPGVRGVGASAMHGARVVQDEVALGQHHLAVLHAEGLVRVRDAQLPADVRAPERGVVLDGVGPRPHVGGPHLGGDVLQGNQGREDEGSVRCHGPDDSS